MSQYHPASEVQPRASGLASAVAAVECIPGIRSLLADVALPEPAQASQGVEPDSGPAPEGSGAASQRPSGPGAARTPLDEELLNAAAICRRGQQQVASMFQEARMGRAVDIDGCQALVQEVTDSVSRHPGALVSLARLKTQDNYSYMHSVATCALMVALARQLGMDAERCRAAGVAGLLHDVGKALMPPVLLKKPGRLSDDEFRLIRTHPERGRELLATGLAASPDALDVVLHHHERIDGSGYPDGLAGEAISLFARMGAVCDVYDAITSNRPYKAGWDPAQSLSQMASWSGHFDGAVFSAFVRSLGIYPTGSVVRLASGRVAVVVAQNPRALITPVVTVFRSAPPVRDIPPERLDLAWPGCGDRILGREPTGGQSWREVDSLWLPPELQALVQTA